MPGENQPPSSTLTPRLLQRSRALREELWPRAHDFMTRARVVQAPAHAGIFQASRSLLRPLYCLVADGGGVTAVFPPMPMSLLSVPGAAVDCDSTCFGMKDLAVDLAGKLRGIQLFLGHTRLENHRFVILGLRWTNALQLSEEIER